MATISPDHIAEAISRLADFFHVRHVDASDTEWREAMEAHMLALGFDGTEGVEDFLWYKEPLFDQYSEPEEVKQGALVGLLVGASARQLAEDEADIREDPPKRANIRAD